MVKRVMPTVIHLDYNCEYSLDDGQTWTQLPADTRREIDGSLLPESRIVKIRSTENVTSIDPKKLGLRLRLFDSLNLKNGKTLTSTNDLFAYVIADNVRAHNLPLVTDAHTMFYRARTKTISVGELPEILTTKNMFDGVISKVVSDIKFGKPGEYLDSTAWMFYNAKIGILGDVILKGKTISEGEGMFYGADIDMFPYIKLAFSGRKDRLAPRGYRNSRIFNYLRSRYILESEIRSISGDESSSEYEDQYIGYDNEYNQNSFMGNSNLRFSGMSIILNRHKGSSGRSSSKIFTNSSKLRTPFSMFAKLSGDYSFISEDRATTDYALSNTLIDETVGVDAMKPLESATGFVEFPNWFEQVVELDSFTNTNLIGVKSITTLGLKATAHFDGKRKSTEDGQRFKDPVAFNSTDEINVTYDNIYGSRSGVRVKRTGTSYEAFNANGELMSTFADTGSNVFGGNTNQDGTKFYVFEAEQFDDQSTDNQTLTGSIRTYRLSDGVLIDTFDVQLEENQQFVGAWRYGDESNWKILVRTWHNEAGDMSETPNILTARSDSGTILATEQLSITGANLVTPNYFEEAEFMCINTATGEMSRCIGA
jgi:hypothetical protein